MADVNPTWSDIRIKLAAQSCGPKESSRSWRVPFLTIRTYPHQSVFPRFLLGVEWECQQRGVGKWLIGQDHGADTLDFEFCIYYFLAGGSQANWGLGSSSVKRIQRAPGMVKIKVSNKTQHSACCLAPGKRLNVWPRLSSSLLPLCPGKPECITLEAEECARQWESMDIKKEAWKDPTTTSPTLDIHIRARVPGPTLSAMDVLPNVGIDHCLSYLSSGYLSQSLSAYLSISKMLNTSQFILTHTAVPFLRTLLQYTHTSMKLRIPEVPCCHKRLEIPHMVRTRQLVE